MQDLLSDLLSGLSIAGAGLILCVNDTLATSDITQITTLLGLQQQLMCKF